MRTDDGTKIIGVELRLVDHWGCQHELTLLPCDIDLPNGTGQPLQGLAFDIGVLTIHTNKGDVNVPYTGARIT